MVGELTSRRRALVHHRRVASLSRVLVLVLALVLMLVVSRASAQEDRLGVCLPDGSESWAEVVGRLGSIAPHFAPLRCDARGLVVELRIDEQADEILVELADVAPERRAWVVALTLREAHELARERADERQVEPEPEEPRAGEGEASDPEAEPGPIAVGPTEPVARPLAELAAPNDAPRERDETSDNTVARVPDDDLASARHTVAFGFGAQAMIGRTSMPYVELVGQWKGLRWGTRGFVATHSDIAAFGDPARGATGFLGARVEVNFGWRERGRFMFGGHLHAGIFRHRRTEELTDPLANEQTFVLVMPVGSMGFAFVVHPRVEVRLEAETGAWFEIDGGVQGGFAGSAGLGVAVRLGDVVE